MTKKELQLPQLSIVTKPGKNGKYLERLSAESDKPKVNLTFQEDNRDPRIIAIKYEINGEEGKGNILYFSETYSKYAIVTFNLGYAHSGKVLAKDYLGHNLGLNIEHSPKEGLRARHIQRINNIENIRNDLIPKYVSKRYQDFFYNLEKNNKIQ